VERASEAAPVPARAPKTKRRRRDGPSVRTDLRSLRRLLRYTRPYRGRLVLGLAAGAAYGVFSGAFPKMVEYGSRRLFEGDERASLVSVLAMAAVIPVYFLVRGAMSFLNTYCLSWVSSRMLRDLRTEVFSHLQLLSCSRSISSCASACPR
jgi:ABC-type multidrug transport system fused ATPase/permease subunit